MHVSKFICNMSDHACLSRVLMQLQLYLNPFIRTSQGVFFCSPTAKHYCSSGSPTYTRSMDTAWKQKSQKPTGGSCLWVCVHRLRAHDEQIVFKTYCPLTFFHKAGKYSGHFHHNCSATCGIDRSEHPSVSVIAHQNVPVWCQRKVWNTARLVETDRTKFWTPAINPHLPGSTAPVMYPKTFVTFLFLFDVVMCMWRVLNRETTTCKRAYISSVNNPFMFWQKHSLVVHESWTDLVCNVDPTLPRRRRFWTRHPPVIQHHAKCFSLWILCHFWGFFEDYHYSDWKSTQHLRSSAASP